MIAAEPEPPITPTPDCPIWLALYDMGFSLIPLKPIDKTPLIPWRAYQKRRASLLDRDQGLSFEGREGPRPFDNEQFLPSPRHGCDPLLPGKP